MSQQGIFSIAPDAQPSQSNGGAVSPFTSVSPNGGEEAAVQSSPFTAVTPSPFEQVQPVAEAGGARGGIPEPRPEGQPPAMKLASGSEDGQGQEGQPAVHNVFEPAPAQQQSGGPFQMNGFPEQVEGQFTEAAPVAQPQSDSPFAVVRDDGHDYEAAKAELEPQQDFAAVQPRFTPDPVPSPAVEKQQPTLTPIASSALVTPAPQVQQQAAAIPAQTSPGYQQLELRAIFGVDHPLDQREIIQRARTLPGVRNVAIVGQQEASALANFRQAMQAMGFGDSQEMKLNAGGGDIDFLSEGGTTIAVLHEGAYAPGVQETLIIVAREIGKLA